MEIARERRGGGGSRDYRAARSIVAVRLFVFLDFWKDHILTGMNGSLKRGEGSVPEAEKEQKTSRIVFPFYSSSSFVQSPLIMQATNFP